MQKKLYRSKTNRVIAGVCGGIGEYFEIDPVLVRLVWLIFFFAGGSGVIAYIIAMIIIPEETGKKKKVKKTKFSEEKFEKNMEMFFENEGRTLGGIILITIGSVFLLSNLGFFSWFSWTTMWPWVIIIIGIFLVFYKGK